MSQIEKSKILKEIESVIDWKSCLYSLVQSKNASAKRDLVLSNFILRIRERLPETKWYFLLTPNLDTAKLTLFERWLFKQVARPDWPFPTSVFIDFKQDKYFIAKIHFLESASSLPDFSSMKGMMYTEMKEKSYTGWEITVQQDDSHDLKESLK